MKKYLSEFVATFLLIFCGCGAAVINQQTNGAVGGGLGISITFGLIVTVLVYTFGEISGCFINPAIAIGFSIAGLFNKKELIPYIISQIVGATTAEVVLKLMFPANLNLGATLPSGSQLQSFVFEIILTFLLMAVVIFMAQSSNKMTQQLVGVCAGATVMLEAIFAGPISGASMNPARSLGPAIVTGNFTSIWIYITAPIIGACLAAWFWKFLKPAAN